MGMSPCILDNAGIFLVVDIKDGQVVSSAVVPNTASHGGGGCVAVDEMMKHQVTDVISGEWAWGPKNKFAAAGVRVAGFQGKVQDAIKACLANRLPGLNACAGHGDCDH